MQIITTTESSFIIGNTIYPSGLYNITLVKSYNPNKIQITALVQPFSTIVNTAYNQIQLNGVVYPSGKALFDAFSTLTAFNTINYSLPAYLEGKVESVGKIRTMSDQNVNESGLPSQGGNLSTNKAVRVSPLTPLDIPDSYVADFYSTQYVVRLGYKDDAVFFLPDINSYKGKVNGETYSSYFSQTGISITNNSSSIYSVKVITSGYKINPSTGVLTNELPYILTQNYSPVNNFDVNNTSILGLSLSPGYNAVLRWSNSRQRWEQQ